MISFADDENERCWVQCEVPYKGKLRRVYTGLKRFDEDSFELYDQEYPSGEEAKVTATSKAMYGPGDGYDTYGSLRVDKGRTVTVITTENGYAQVEWATASQRHRVWVPLDTLAY